MTNKPDYWFPAKRIGWGWGFPLNWKGWLTVVVYVVILFVGVILFPPGEKRSAFSAVVAIASIGLLGVLVATGEPIGRPSGPR